jgi:DNA-binding NarL/FixJ family response regulator
MTTILFPVETDTIHVAIVEDHPDIRQGVQFIIDSSDGFSSEAFSNAEMALERIPKNVPDLVLMDINLPGMNGIECTRRLKEKYPNMLIMMCSVYDDDDNIFQALAAGANGYILKSAAGEHLLQSLTDLHQGGSPMSSIIARKVVAKFQSNAAMFQQQQVAEEVAQLTPRENEILDLLAQGYRNKEIADKLFVSVNTIRTHIYNIYDKLHVQTRVEALNKSGRGYNPS